MTREERRNVDPEKYWEQRRKAKAKYRQETGSNASVRDHRRYTESEMELIRNSNYTDRQLAQMMGRSLGAIQNKRNRLKEQGYMITPKA